MRLDRPQQQVVQECQVVPGAASELVEMGAHALGALLEGAKLESKLLEGGFDPVRCCQSADDAHLVFANDESEHFVIQDEIFDQGCVRAEVSLQLLELEWLDADQGPAAALLELAQDLRDAAFAIAHRGVQRSKRLGRWRRVAAGRPIDLAVEPAEILAELAQALKKAGFERVARAWSSRQSASQQINQGARAR